MKNYAQLITLVGVVVGAWLGYLYSSSLSQKQNLANYRYAAYQDFIRVNFLDYGGDPNKLDTEKEKQFDAYHRVAVFSSASVVKEVASFLTVAGQRGNTCDETDRKQADLKMHQAIRREV